MIEFDVQPVSRALEEALRAKIDAKTKPLGALGRLEEVAVTVGLVQESLEPRLRAPAVVVFAADHGIAAEGVSAYPPEVTAQMVANFLAGGAAINVFARLHGMPVRVVDAGVAGEVPASPDLLDRKIAPGTRNAALEPAMTRGQADEALAAGAAVIADLHATGCNVVALGDMGIGNTSSAAMLMSLLLDLPIEACVGPGTGLDRDGVRRKCEVLGRAVARARASLGAALDARGALAECGGFEIAMMAGAMLAAAERSMLVLVDGFIATAALLVARGIAPAVTDYCLLGHRSDEPGHDRMLEGLGARPLLDLGMRLGEGTGAVLAWPLVAAAAAFLRDMASFESAGVSGRGGG